MRIICAFIAVLLITSCYIQQPMRVTWVDPDREQQEKIAELAGQLTGPLQGNNCRASAVLPFIDINKQISVLGRALAIDMQSALANRLDRSNVVERDWDLLVKAVKEMELGQTGLIDPKTAARTGRMIGADTLIMGWVYDTGTSIKVTIKAMSVEKGRILGTAEGFLSRTSNRIQQSRQYLWK